MGLTRRTFLFSAAAGLGAALLERTRIAALLGRSHIEGSIVGAAHAVGHKLRGGALPEPTSTRQRAVVIVGGGAAGLSAGWKLKRSGFTDFEVHDLEAQVGGNARWGKNEVSSYPWGAHYLPFPSPDSRAVSELLRELKVEIGKDRKGKPVYDERCVCFAPQERLFLYGRWQGGLFPRLGADKKDLAELDRFEALMDSYRRRRGKDGKRAFAIPMELSSRDPEFLSLDSLSMDAFLEQKGFASSRLRWYVDYGCRDDFGCAIDETSAWAGIHYFAARGAGEDGQVLTWPEGNGFLVQKLAQTLDGHLKSNSLVYRVAPQGEGVAVDRVDVATGKTERVLAKRAIVCAPQFVAQRLVPGLAARGQSIAQFRYAPWLVANLTVENPPDGKGAGPAWDNVLFSSEGLGYVVATHQSLSLDRRRSVWTYYKPFPGPDEAAARARLLATPWEGWRDFVLADLKRAHPELASRVRRLDVMLWGHAMVKPRPGFVWSAARREAAEPLGPIRFGHSDLSGFSIFEEAQYRGIAAAEAAMAELGHPYRSSL